MTQFIINITNTPASTTQSFVKGSEVNQIIVPDLTPNTMYEVRVAIVTHGGGIITSQPDYVTTQDGGKSTHTLESKYYLDVSLVRM